MPWMTWSPKGDRLAYFVRTNEGADAHHPERADQEHRAAHRDEVGRRARVAVVLARRQDDRVCRRCATPSATSTSSISRRRRSPTSRGRLRRLRGPTYSPDGKFIIYNARVSGNQKLFRLDLDTKKKTQITFGTVDETAAQFIDDHTLVFSSTATDPNVPLEPDVARNGNIYNIWTLDLKNGELRQYTDALGGNWSPVVLREGANASRIAFVSYYKGDYTLAHARAQGAAPHRRVVRLRRARPDHRLPGAAPAHAGGRQHAEEEDASRRCSSRGARR